MKRWYARRDTHPVVEHWKARVRGKKLGDLWPLQRQRTLGTILVALGRADEGLRVLDEAVASVRWTGKSNPWFIAATCAAVAAWSRKARVLPVELRKFTAPPAHFAQRPEDKWWNAEQFTAAIAEHMTKLQSATGALAIDTMAFHLGHVAFYRYLPLLAPHHRGAIALRSVDTMIRNGLRTIAKQAEHD